MIRVASTPMIPGVTLINNGRAGWLPTEIPVGGVLDNDAMLPGTEYLAVLTSGPSAGALEWSFDGTFAFTGPDGSYQLAYDLYANGVPSGSSTAALIIGGTPATVTGVTVQPASTAVAAGATQQFTATVAGTNSPSQAVTWTTSAGSINSSGLLTAPAATAVQQTVTVTATSSADGSKSGTASVTVAAAVAVPTGYPAPGDVRTGVVYGPAGELVGSMTSGAGAAMAIPLGAVGLTLDGRFVLN